MSYEVYLEEQPTGRTHQVNDGGVLKNVPIPGADGEPETEYVLVANIDGHAVPLERYNRGQLQHFVGLEHTAIDSSSSSSSQGSSGEQQAAAEPASPAPGEGTAGEGAQQQPAAGDQPSG